MKKSKTVKLLVGLLLIFTMLFTAACGNKASEKASNDSPKKSTSDTTKKQDKATDKKETKVEETNVKVNVQPADKAPDKPLKIATICVQNNPFWFPVRDGVMYAKKVLAEKNTTVDWITIDSFDAKKFTDAIETCIVKQYDAITVVGVSDAIVPAINKAVAAGIPVMTFNCEPDKQSKRTAFFGQDLYNAGVLAGETLSKEIGGEGEVAIITGLYSVNSHELRRKGGIESFEKYAGIKIVGQAENQDKAETAYSLTKDFLTANPNLKGIYVTAGGPFGAAKAIDELGLTGKVKVVCFDFVDETIDYVRKGIISATIGQDPFGQGYDPIVYAYNMLVTGEKPANEKMWTRLDVVTQENVDEIIGKAK